MARERGRPVAMHVAESREELELLAAGTGPMAELLQSRGVWQPDLFGGTTWSSVLEVLATATRALVIHGNYLSNDEDRAARQTRGPNEPSSIARAPTPISATTAIRWPRCSRRASRSPWAPTAGPRIPI